jgi:hypothetical protein
MLEQTNLYDIITGKEERDVVIRLRKPEIVK